MGVTIGTLALVVVLSVYNGFDSLIRSMFSAFDPDLKITAVEGKTFNPQAINLQEIKNTEGVAYMAQVLEESAIIKYGQSQDVVKIKGVSPNYTLVTNLDSLIFDGKCLFEDEGNFYAIAGLGVANNLGIRTNLLDPLHVYAAKKGERVSVNLSRSLNHDYIFPSGIFSVQETYDSEYILVPLEFARSLFETQENVSALELKLKPGANVDNVQKRIQSEVGEKFHVKNKYQQQELVYKVMKSEGWAIYFILVFILIIASFNILGSLTMLIIDKKDDIAILKSMGAGQGMIRRAFLFEGWLISLSGAILGVFAGLVICWTQVHFELLKFPGNGSFAVPAYPVEIQFTDLLLIFFTVITIGFVVAWFPVRYISGKYIALNPKN